MKPNSISKLVLNNDNMTSKCKSPDERLIQFTPKDKFNNNVSKVNIGELGLIWYGQTTYKIF